MVAAGTTQQERSVLAELDVDELVRDLEAMVGLAPVGGTPGEVAVQRWAAARLRDLGCAVQAWDVDLAAEARAEGFPGMEVERSALVGVVGRWDGPGEPRPGHEPPALALCGHTDVVPVGDARRWTRDPHRLEVRGGVLSGRGACDMLAGVAAILAAVRAVVRSGVGLDRPLGVHLVSAEEDGGAGAFATLRAGHGADACVIAEPTGGAVIPANAGSLTFRLEVPGRAAHGSTRTLGENPVDHLVPVLAALRSLEARRNAGVGGLFEHLDLAAPLSVGVVRAGDWASTVPDLLVAEGRYGVLPGESLADARAAFEDAVARAADGDRWLHEHPVRVTWPGGAFAPGSLPAGDPLLGEVLDAAADATGTRPRVEGAPYGSDLRHYAAHGIPTVQFGPGELRQAHAVDESVRLAEVAACAQTYALLALRRCATGQDQQGMTRT